jgi:hypothetical protein
MESLMITKDYMEAVKALKDAITKSRYRAAQHVNKEVLYLNYAIGRFISINSRTAKWGSNAIKIISELLQKELPGLRGYSESNIKLMRTFYEGWKDVFENRQLTTGDFNRITIKELEIRQLSTDEFTENDLECFLNVGFSNHFKTLKHIETDGRSYIPYIKRTSGKTSGSLAGYGGFEEANITTFYFS